MIFNILSVAVCGLLAVSVIGSPTGAPPPAVCYDVGVKHHAPEQEGPPPYKINLSSHCVHSGSKIDVTISGLSDQDFFRGYLIQARKNNTKDRVGSFSGPGQFVDCNGGIKNSAMHNEGSDKNSITLQWTAPVNFTGTVVFDSAIVKTVKVFWSSVRSEPLVVYGSSETASSAHPILFICDFVLILCVLLLML